MDTLLVAVGPNDANRIDQIVTEVTNVTDEETDVILGHVMSFSRYRNKESTSEMLFNMGYNVSPPGAPDPDSLAGRTTVVQDLQDALEEEGQYVTIRGAFGDRKKELLRILESEEADHLIIGGRKRSRTGKLVFGSLAQRLLLAAPCPVTLVREEGDMKKTVANAFNPVRGD